MIQKQTSKNDELTKLYDHCLESICQIHKHISKSADRLFFWMTQIRKDDDNQPDHTSLSLRSTIQYSLTDEKGYIYCEGKPIGLIPKPLFHLFKLVKADTDFFSGEVLEGKIIEIAREPNKRNLKGIRIALDMVRQQSILERFANIVIE